MTLLAIIIIAISVGAIYGAAYGFLALGCGMFAALVLRAIFARIPIQRLP